MAAEAPSGNAAVFFGFEPRCRLLPYLCAEDEIITANNRNLFLAISAATLPAAHIQREVQFGGKVFSNDGRQL